VAKKGGGWDWRWCPSIAWMKYEQSAHARCPLLMHGIRSTSRLRYGIRHPPLSSGDGVLRCVRRKAEIASRDVRPGRRQFDSRSLSAVRGLDRPRSGSPVMPDMAAGMMDSVWTMEALLARPARPVSNQPHCVALLSTLSRDTTHEGERVVFSCLLPEDRRRSTLNAGGTPLLTRQ
jgi:hypothetical protein